MSDRDYRMLEDAAQMLGTTVNELVSEIPRRGWKITIYHDQTLGQFTVALAKGTAVITGTSDTSVQGALARAAYQLSRQE